MPGISQVIFVAQHLTRSEIVGRHVLDVGSCDHNGSIRPLLAGWSPASYVGVDIVPGPGVDVVCSAENLGTVVPHDSIDVLICLEMLEHARHWRRCITEMKQALRPGGTILLTTRSPGYPCHGFPNDFWRFDCSDMRAIFADFDLTVVTPDPRDPGVFVCATKPAGWIASDLPELAISCVLTGARESGLPEHFRRTPYYRRLSLKQHLRSVAAEGFLGAGRLVTRLLRLNTQP